MKKLRFIMIMLLVVTLPISNVFAMIVPDIALLSGEQLAANAMREGGIEEMVNSLPMAIGPIIPKTVVADLVELFRPVQSPVLSPPPIFSIQDKDAVKAELTAEQLEVALQEELLIKPSAQFWTKKKITGTVLLAIGILVGVLLLSASAGGSSSGSGSGSGSGNGGSSNLPPQGPQWEKPGEWPDVLEPAITTPDSIISKGVLPNIDPMLTDPGVMLGVGGPNGIPNNPEPATFVLVGLGLLLPLLRKKFLR